MKKLLIIVVLFTISCANEKQVNEKFNPITLNEYVLKNHKKMTFQKLNKDSTWAYTTVSIDQYTIYTFWPDTNQMISTVNLQTLNYYIDTLQKRHIKFKVDRPDDHIYTIKWTDTIYFPL